MADRGQARKERVGTAARRYEAGQAAQADPLMAQPSRFAYVRSLVHTASS